MMHAVTRVNTLPLETRGTSPQRIHGSQSVSMYPHNSSPFGRIVCEPTRVEHNPVNELYGVQGSPGVVHESSLYMRTLGPPILWHF